MLPFFTFNDETKKNSHGFYLLNAGGRFERFTANPVMLDNHNLDRLIGKWENLRVEGALLLANPVFDEGVDLGKERQGQVERGFLRGASPGILPLAGEYRNNPVTGESELYVTEWDLIEGSTTPVPSNAGALTLRIYGPDQQPIPDQRVVAHLQNIISLNAGQTPPMDLPTIQDMEKINLTAEARVALGINESADGAAISAAIVNLHGTLKDKNNRIEVLEKEAQAVARKAAEDMVALAITEGKITADKREEFITLGMDKPDLAKATLDSIPAKVSLSEKVKTITGGGIPPARQGWTLLRWLKEDANGLAKIKAEEPDTYAAIKEVSNNK